MTMTSMVLVSVFEAPAVDGGSHLQHLRAGRDGTANLQANFMLQHLLQVAGYYLNPLDRPYHAFSGQPNFFRWSMRAMAWVYSGGRITTTQCRAVARRSGSWRHFPDGGANKFDCPSHIGEDRIVQCIPELCFTFGGVRKPDGPDCCRTGGGGWRGRAFMATQGREGTSVRWVKHFEIWRD